MSFRREEAVKCLQDATGQTQEWALATELGLYAQMRRVGSDAYWEALFTLLYEFFQRPAVLLATSPFLTGCVRPIAWNHDHQHCAEHPGIPAAIELALDELSAAVQDKTLGSKSTVCVMCKSARIKFSMRQTRRGDEAADYHMVCEACGYRQIIKG